MFASSVATAGEEEGGEGNREAPPPEAWVSPWGPAGAQPGAVAASLSWSKECPRVAGCDAVPSGGRCCDGCCDCVVLAVVMDAEGDVEAVAGQDVPAAAAAAAER